MAPTLSGEVMSTRFTANCYIYMLKEVVVIKSWTLLLVISLCDGIRIL